MKTLSIMAGAGLMLFGSIGMAQSQTSGTPNSPFPDAAPNEVEIINGVPCRTILDQGTNRRIPIQCATSAGMVGMEPTMTGSILAGPRAGAPISGSPGSLFPNAAPHEIRIINGVPCRTVLIPGSNERVPVECAH